MDELLNQVVEHVYVNDDNTLIVFKTQDDKLFAYRAYGDCCSHSWINTLTGLANLLDRPVQKVTLNKELRDEANDNGNVIKYYGVTLETIKGFVDLEYRNSSNGYYGGSLDFDKTYSLGDSEPLTEIHADFDK